MILSGCLCRNAVEGAFMKIKIITLGILSSLTGVYYLLFDTNNSMGQVGIENFPERARSAISRSTGIPVNFLTVENESDVADTGIKQFKLQDQTGNLYSVALDANGDQISDEAVNQAFQKINSRGFEGKFQSKLAERIRKGGGESIRVVFQLKTRDREVFQARTEAERQFHFEKVRARIRVDQQQFVEQAKSLKHQVIYQSLYAPMVVVSLPLQTIEALARRSDVERVYEEGKGSVRLNVSRVVVQADTVNSRGYTGTAQYVGVVEPERIGNHLNLPASERTLCRPTASAFTTDHKTLVAGVIQSTATLFRGLAPRIKIIDGVMGAGNSDAEVMAATDCVINSAAATNLSYGNETNGVFDALARYFDSLVYNTGASVAVAASNNCNSSIGSPEIAFNVIGVGLFDNKNTVNFNDDVPSCTAGFFEGAYMNPLSPNNDREEPDVVAPGIVTSTSSNGGFQQGGGTSYAAPHVTAGIALLRSRKTSLFTFAAEVRAIMLASARHNIEGNSRLSNRDGAGAIMLAAADTVVANGQSDFIFVEGATASNFLITRTFTANSGQKVRVAISWDHKMPLGSTITQPTTDLDLQVRCGNSTISTSASRDNNYEIVEFIANSCPSGYTSRIVNSRSSAGLENIGYAVSKTDL
jgi:hypothetical protein